LDNAHAFIMNSNILNTKRDIYIEDMTMCKIIKYVSHFSTDVKTYLESHRSKEALLHAKNEKKSKGASDFIFDMDEIDLSFVNLVLDTLENFELEKLCIVICNRYQINERLGRYVVSVANRYSNIKNLYKDFSRYAVGLGNYSLVIQKDISLIANKALHGVFEMVNPAYLKLKKYSEIVDETNSLGKYCYRNLMLLGYWKKLVYIMDCHNSLAITSAFADYENYKLIYLLNFGKITKENAPRMQTLAKACTFEWLPFKSPSNPLEVQALILALDSILYDLNSVYNFFYDNPSKLQITECPKFSLEFPCCSALWKYLFSGKEQDLNGIYEAFDLGAKNFLYAKEFNELAIRDFCLGLMYLFFGRTKQVIKTLLLNYPSYYYTTLLQATDQILELICNNKAFKIYSEKHYAAYIAILSAFGIRRFEERDCQLGCGRLFIMHRSSIFFSTYVQINQSIAIKNKNELNKSIENYIFSKIENIHYALASDLHKVIKKLFTQEQKRRKVFILSIELENNFNGSFVDLEADYVYVIPEMISEALTKKIVRVSVIIDGTSKESVDGKVKRCKLLNIV